MGHTFIHRVQQIYEAEFLRRHLREIYLAKILRFVPPIEVPPHAGPDPVPDFFRNQMLHQSLRNKIY